MFNIVKAAGGVVKNTNDEIKDLLIGFINNLKSKKISAAETKLWKRVCEAMQKLASQLP